MSMHDYQMVYQETGEVEQRKENCESLEGGSTESCA